MKSRFASTLVVLGLASCGGRINPEVPPEEILDTGVVADTSPAVDTDPPTPDTAPPPRDYGVPSETYPAFTPDMPTLVDKGGGPLTAPAIVTVTYPGDVNADSYEAFGDTIGATAYWKAITAEYGVLPATSGKDNHVRNVDALPTAMTDGEVDSYVMDHATNYKTYGWAAPTDQSIYALYIPKTTAISLRGAEACASGVGGYHSSTFAGSLEVAYAIILQCSFGSKSGTPRTNTASHEIAEATLDPHPQTGTPGFNDVDKDHIAWHFFMQGNTENGDLCEIYREARYSDTVDPGFAYSVQRQWSNVTAKAGHNPCVPLPTSGSYYNVVALEQESVTMNAVTAGAGSKQPTKGYHVGVGETKTFPIGFWSDGPMPAAWSVSTTETTGFGTPPTTKRLTATIDRKSGRNGEKAYVTVTVNSVDSKKATVLTIVSTDGATQHFMPLVISSQ